MNWSPFVICFIITSTEARLNLTCPIFILSPKDNKWYGAQCKFFLGESNDTKYRQIKKSLKKAISYFEGKLDVVYIYTNAELRHVCSDEEINSQSSTPRIEIARMAKKNNIDIKWHQADNILDTVKESKNQDLYRMYFSDSRECEFIENTISIEDNTFLQSDEFINLKFTNGCSVENLKSNFVEGDYGLILGTAGTGKSVAMKKLFKDLSDEFNKFYFEKNETENNVCIPVFIRLRECINGNVESLIRDRLTDYDLPYRNESSKFYYLFDGLDEVPFYDVSKILHSIKQLSEQNEVKGIAISSRLDSSNLSYFRQVFSWDEYIFKKISIADIEAYFISKNNDAKLMKLKSVEYCNLINEIDDIFSVNILWENIDVINHTTSKIEIIELSILYWIRNYSKLNELSLLQPKQIKICELCQEISYRMQKKLSYSISLDEVQDIVKDFEVKSANEINTIIEALEDLFLESSYHGDSKTEMSFRHKRFQEFFLYQKIENEYYNNPEILRELKLFSNRDFMINIFLRTSLKRAELSRCIYKCLALRLLESYLGSYYVSKEYKDELIGRTKPYFYVEPQYSHSDAFLYLLSTYNENELKELIRNENLNIGDAINEDNFPKFVEVYHRMRGRDIAPFSKKEFSLGKISVNHNNIGQLCYYLRNIKNESIDHIYSDFVEESVLSDDNVKLMDYVATEHIREHSFIRMALEFEINYLTTLIEKMDRYMLEVLSYNLVDHQFVNILFQDLEEVVDFRDSFIHRIQDNDEEFYINTLAVYTLISKSNKYQSKISEAFAEANQRNYPAWSRHIGLHVLLAILQNDDCRYELSEFKIGVEITRIAYNGYQDKNTILDEWLKIIMPYNYIYNGWLRYNHSLMLGVYISKLNLDSLMVKKFLRELLNYESVIYIQTVLFTIYKYNKELFDGIVSKGLLDKILQATLKDNKLDDYDSQSESIFQLAVMYDAVDIDRKYELLIYGVDNCIMRPAYRSEELVSRVLPECLYLAYQSYCYDDEEIENKCLLLFSILQTINKTTDNAGYMEYLKWTVEKCNVTNTFLERNLYEVSSYSPFIEDGVFDYNISDIHYDNIDEYYACRVKDVPYESIQFWRNLIEIEFKQDSQLTKLYDTFDKINYPSYFGNECIRYCHLPIAVLYENEETRESIVQYIINKGGVLGMYNMIRMFFITGELYDGLYYIEHLIKFSNLLISNSDFIYTKSNDVMEAICGDWIVDESENVAVSSLNPNIKITWNDYDERETFHAEWATSHPDKTAYRYDYKLFSEGKLMKRFSLVWVDGFRAVLPIPKQNTNVVNREEYLISKIFNHSIDEFNSYMRRSRLTVQ